MGLESSSVFRRDTLPKIAIVGKRYLWRACPSVDVNILLARQGAGLAKLALGQPTACIGRFD
jgi:hypothetical protein